MRKSRSHHHRLSQWWHGRNCLSEDDTCQTKTPRRESLISRRERLRSQLAIIESQKGSRWRQTRRTRMPKSHHQGPSWWRLGKNIFWRTEIPEWKHQEERDEYHHCWWLGVKKDQDEGRSAGWGGQNRIIRAQVDDGSNKITSDGWKFLDENTKKIGIGITIGDDWESRRIKMRANMKDEVAEIASSRPRLVMS